MTDWLDEALENLPMEPCPPDLVMRAKARLAAARERRHRLHQGVRLTLAGAAALGLWMAIARLETLVASAPALPQGAPESWLEAALASPPQATLEVLIQGIAWGNAFGAGLEPGLAIALALLAVPALCGVAGLIGGMTTRGGAES